MQELKVLESETVDLLEPFPVAQVRRLRGWLYCYKSLTMTDDMPKMPEEQVQMVAENLYAPGTRSWGIIDKHNIIKSKHEAPLVGFISFQQVSPYNGYFHTACSRQAWGQGFMDEAGWRVLKEMFESTPELTRVSAAIFSKNAAAKALCYRLGFEKEGVLKHFALVGGQPIDVIHFGLTKERWAELCQSPQQFLLSQNSPQLQEQPLEQLDPVESKVV